MKKANIIVMWIAGIVLLAASALKVHQLITEPIISKGFWESWEFFLIQIPLEMGLGIWLICGLFRKAGWLLGLIAFVGFIGVTLFKGLSGEESCGCFGVIKVNPWITLTAIDIPIFLLLAIFRPKGEKLLPPPWPSLAHFLTIAIPTFILLPTVEYILITNKQAKPDVENWVSNQAEQNQWPMLDDINIKQQLQIGLWVVLLYHYDCPDCAKAIPEYEKMYKSLKGNENAINFAFIEMPPYGNEKQQLISPESEITRGRLSDKKKWFYQTPVVVVLDNGKALKGWEGKAPGLDELLNAAFGQ
ncbi:MAG: MauE/DoxX family redox-associated membrane protein [Sedimentisphaerales bacterium]